MFRSNFSSNFLYFVGKVFDEITGKVSTRVNGWQYFMWMSIYYYPCVDLLFAECYTCCFKIVNIHSKKLLTDIVTCVLNDCQ